MDHDEKDDITVERTYSMIDKGPEDKTHFPEFKKGCYYGRAEDCCWFCFVRLSLSPLRQPIPEEIDSTSEHPIVGMDVKIPMVDQSNETVIDVKGTIVKAYQTDNSPDVVTVRLNDGSTISLAAKPSLQLD